MKKRIQPRDLLIRCKEFVEGKPLCVGYDFEEVTADDTDFLAAFHKWLGSYPNERRSATMSLRDVPPLATPQLDPPVSRGFGGHF